MNVAEEVFPCDTRTCRPVGPVGVALSLKSGRFDSFQVRFSLTSLPSIALFSCSPFPRFPQRELIQDKTACGKASQKKTEVIISEVPCDWRFQFLPKAKGTSASRS